jgi:hypothetical protein
MNKKEIKGCSVYKCEGEHKARGLCSRHYRQMMKHGKILIDPIKMCIVKGCKQPSHSRGFCRHHDWQMKKHGHILERTKYTPNKFLPKGNICKIQICDNWGTLKCHTIIDADDIVKVQGYKWCSDKISNIFNNQVGLLSRFVMNVTDLTCHVDHINHDRLDNRKENLRVCIQADNNLNKSKYKNNTSGYKGVVKHPSQNLWQAQVKHRGKIYKSKYFNTKEEAARAYNELAMKHHGEFACPNTVETLPQEVQA